MTNVNDNESNPQSETTAWGLMMPGAGQVIVPCNVVPRNDGCNFAHYMQDGKWIGYLGVDPCNKPSVTRGFWVSTNREQRKAEVFACEEHAAYLREYVYDGGVHSHFEESHFVFNVERHTKV